ncbi:small integral membrane protein 3 [Ara ararauna]
MLSWGALRLYPGTDRRSALPSPSPPLLSCRPLPLPPLAGRASPGGAKRRLLSPAGVLRLPPPLAAAERGAGPGPGQRRRMDLPDPAGPAALPKHILDIWVIVLIILATILVMTALVLCPATAVIIYRVQTHPTRNGIV